MNTTVVETRHVTGANWVNVVLGIWVIISPFVLGFSNLMALMWNDVAVGIAVALLALSRSPTNRAAPMLNVILGCWLIASAFVLGVVSVASFWNSIIVGIVIAIVALFATNTSPAPTVPVSPPDRL